MAGHAAAHRQDALRHLHALNVLGARLQAHQNNLRHFAALHSLFGLIGSKHHLAAGSARAGGKALANHFRGLQGSGVKLRVQQAVQLLGLYAKHSFLLGNHALVHKVHRNLQRGGSRALAVARLKHEQLAVLDGELHVLHIAVMVLQALSDLRELLVHFGHFLFQLGDRAGRTDAGHHVFALGVDEVFAEQRLLARGRVARESHAGAGTVARVAERHALHVHSGAPIVGDLVHAAVHIGAGVIPRAEHGLHSLNQLLFRVGGEVFAHLFLVQGLELHHQFLHVVGIQLHVLRDAFGLFHLVDDLLEVGFGHLHHNVREHLHETAVGIVSKAGVVRQLRKALYGLIVQAQVQDGVHHAGHGSARARAHRYQQGVVHIAELLAGNFLQLADVLVDVGHNLFVDLAAIVVVLRAGLGGNGEALGHRHAGVGHLGQVCTLAAEDLAHVLVALAEQVQVFLLAQVSLPPKLYFRHALPCRETCPCMSELFRLFFRKIRKRPWTALLYQSCFLFSTTKTRKFRDFSGFFRLCAPARLQNAGFPLQ